MAVAPDEMIAATIDCMTPPRKADCSGCTVSSPAKDAAGLTCAKCL